MSTNVLIRPMVPADVPALADLYLRAYESETQTFEDAAAEMRSVFEGTWGVFWPEASPAAWIDHEPVSVVQAVRRPARDSMPDAPDCPWLIEVFTDPRYRRTGLARGLLAVACGVIQASGERRIGLTVDENNIPAVALYKSLGFSEEM